MFISRRFKRKSVRSNVPHSVAFTNEISAANSHSTLLLTNSIRTEPTDAGSSEKTWSDTHESDELESDEPTTDYSRVSTLETNSNIKIKSPRRKAGVVSKLASRQRAIIGSKIPNSSLEMCDSDTYLSCSDEASPKLPFKAKPRLLRNQMDKKAKMSTVTTCTMLSEENPFLPDAGNLQNGHLSDSSDYNSHGSLEP